MISYLLMMLLVLCGSVAISLISGKKIGWSILFYFLSIIFLLYVFGLVIPLNISFYLIIVVTIVGLIIGIRKGKNIKEVFKNPVLYLFLIISLFLYFINNGKGLMMIDEYTHWGDVVYAMFQNNVFSVNAVNDSWYASYPPAISLFQYFFMKINMCFSENILYFGYQLLGVGLFLPFLDKIKFKSKLHFLIILVVMIVMPLMLFGNYYNSIYVDAILGMVFGFTFVYPYFYKKMDKFNILLLGFALFVLTLLKDAGLFLSIISLINLLFVLDKKDKKYYFINFSICLCFVLFAKLSWECLILLNDVVRSHESTFALSSLVDVFTGTGDDTKIKVKDKFISAFSSDSILTKPLNLTYFSLTFILALIVYLIYKNDKKYFKSLVLLIGGSFIYMFGLMIIFMFNFNESDALELLSYGRYSIIYLNGVLFFVAISLITKYQDMKRIGLVAIIMLIFVPTGTLTNLIHSNTDKSRNEFVSYISKIKKDEKVMVYSDAYQKFEYAKYHYLLRPIKLTDDCNENCISSEIKNIEKKKYDYLYIDKINGDVSVDEIKLKSGKWYKVTDGQLVLDN